MDYLFIFFVALWSIMGIIGAACQKSTFDVENLDRSIKTDYEFDDDYTHRHKKTYKYSPHNLRYIKTERGTRSADRDGPERTWVDTIYYCSQCNSKVVHREWH